jgi:hypothetical protein
MAKITVCGRTVYFSACAWENVQGGCDVYEADFDTEISTFGVVDEVRPTKGINSKKWDSQPAISCDAKTMFFASNREGGQGGTDIWMSTLGTDGIWDPPTNLGPSINTAGDEEAPYIAPDGITLYFSSDGHPGFGEADIFRTILIPLLEKLELRLHPMGSMLILLLLLTVAMEDWIFIKLVFIEQLLLKKIIL